MFREDSTAKHSLPSNKTLPAVRAGMHYRFIALPWLHVLYFRSIEAGPWNIVEGTAAAKGAVPPEGWGREPDDRKAKAPVRITQADGGLFASRWPLCVGLQKA